MNPPITEQAVFVAELSERELRALARLRRRAARLQAWSAHACVGLGSPREARAFVRVRPLERPEPPPVGGCPHPQRRMP